MLYRLLGKLFFLFYICPFIRKVASFITVMVLEIAVYGSKEQQKKDEADRARSRRDHPAGSRLTQE
jgi:hypothetical protein